MKLKKICGLFAVLVMGAALIGCSADKSPEEQVKDDHDLDVGILINFNLSEQKQAAAIKQASTRRGGLNSEEYPSFTYFESLNSMITALDSGSIEVMSVHDSVAEYLMNRNPGKYEETDFINAGLSDSFCFAVREEDKELLSELNKAISAMQASGKLGFLTREYIDEVAKSEAPSAVSLEKISGAPTLKVAVTGDLPPIDLILPNGKAAGFNTALLSAIGRQMGRNIEIIRSETAVRSALISKRVDVIFWVLVPAEEFSIRRPDLDKSEGIATTIPYYTDKITHLKLKK